MKKSNNIFLLLVVVLVGIVAVITMLVVPSVNNNVLDIVNNIGFAVHPLYAGYALPFAYSGVNNFLQFSSVDASVSRSFDVSDTVIYNRGYVSYDSQAWQPFTLSTTNAVSGAWIYTKGTASISFTPAQLRMSLSRNVSNNTYVVIYSCSLVNNAWDCHDGWQIIKFDAKINSILTPINPSADSSDIGVCLSYGYNCDSKIISGVSKNCGTCSDGMSCNANNICVSSGKTLYVAPSTNGGSDNNNGDISHPFATLEKAWLQISAGDIIYMRGGNYRYTDTINLESKSGSSGKMINIWNYPGEHPVINYTGVIFPSQTQCFGLFLRNDNYVHIKGIRVTGAAQVNELNAQPNYGMILWTNVNNCIFEQMETDHIGGWGVVIGESSSNNLFLNDDSHHNADPYSTADPYGGADGFETGSQYSTNNVFRGCRAWWNSDDGWDFRQAAGLFTLDNSWTFWNGNYPGTFTKCPGNGEGFKLGDSAYGGNQQAIRRIVINSLSFENQAGVEAVVDSGGQYYYVGVQIYNNIFYKNYVGINIQNPGSSQSVLRNNINYANTDDYYMDQWILDQSNHNSWDTSGVTVSNSDFVSINSSCMDDARKADGSLPDCDFLKPSSTAKFIGKGVNVGLSTDGAGNLWKNTPSMGAYEYYP